MRKLMHLCLLLSGYAVYTVLLTGCVDEQPEGASGPDSNTQNKNIFDYATTSDVKIDIDYSLKGYIAPFEVFTENPVTEKDGLLKKKEGVKSILKVYTDKNSRYSGLINLPTATEKVFLYSEAYGLPTCVEAKVTDSGVSFNFKEHLAQQQEDAAARMPALKKMALRSGATDNPYYIQFLGKWDNNGLPDYVNGEWHNGWFFPISEELPDGLINRIQNVLMPGINNSHYAKPTEVVNIHVTEDAHIKLIFIAEMAAWRNAIGYYYYKTQDPPRTKDQFDQLPKYIAFPNCSMWDWDAGIVGNYNPALYPGISMNLAYYQNGQASEIFPQGTTIGWFILPDGFEVDAAGNSKLNITGSKHPIRYSNNEFNQNGSRYMVSIYDKTSGKTVLGFEDGGDFDLKDALFYIDTDPANAIYDPERPTTDGEDEKYPDVESDPIQGTLAFEDLWPNQGDYDMNDVVVTYSTVFTTNKENNIVSMKDVFTPLHKGGQLKSAFGYQLDIPTTAIKNVKIENSSSSADVSGGLENQQDKPVIMLFDDIKKAIAQGPITVNIELNGSISMNKVTHKSLYNPFICVNKTGFIPGQIRKEIHLTNYAPTRLADRYPFGKFNDKSSVDKQGKPIGPYYYVTSELYPFAIDLPVTDYRIPDEMVTIDTFYPDFAGWAQSKGEKNKEWYLKPANK